MSKFDYISIHALHAECDVIPLFKSPISMVFQSTHSMRSATSQHLGILCTCKFQSTHSMRSATKADLPKDHQRPISIHALHAECDLNFSSSVLDCNVFQSTHSMRSATSCPNHRSYGSSISIHALHAECDSQNSFVVKRPENFNPRTPCGVRQ